MRRDRRHTPRASPACPGRTPRARTARRAASPSRPSGRPGPSCPAVPGRRRSPRIAEHVVAVQPRDRAERGIGEPREVGIAVDLVERATVAEHPVEVLDQRQRLDRADVDASGGSTRRAVMSERNSAISRAASSRQSSCVPAGPLQQRVIDIGDVLHILHLLASIAPGPDQQVPRQISSRVTDMRRVVRGDPAGIQGRLCRLAPPTASERWRYPRSSSAEPVPGSSGTSAAGQDSMGARVSLARPGAERNLEGVGQGDQPRLAPGRPDEGQADRQAADPTCRDRDRRVSGDRGGLEVPQPW